MEKILYKIIFAILAITFVSCEEVIEIDLKDAQPEIVFEADISDTTGPYYVKISQTVGFSQNNNLYGITGAFVTISDNFGITDTLTEVSDGIYKTTNLNGIQNSSYYFNAIVNGRQFSSVSSMPVKTILDSVYTTTNSGGGFGGNNHIFVVPKYHDPAGIRNFYRFILFKNGVQTEDVFVQSDENRDGLFIKQPLRTRDTLNTGDIITLEMQCIDEKVYKYFYALSLNFRRGLNQSQTPANPPTNIIGGKLGYFSAHTSQKKSIVVP